MKIIKSTAERVLWKEVKAAQAEIESKLYTLAIIEAELDYAIVYRDAQTGKIRDANVAK